MPGQVSGGTTVGRAHMFEDARKELAGSQTNGQILKALYLVLKRKWSH